jgi:hypothetical protein
MNKEEIVDAVIETINATELDDRTRRNKLILLQAQAALDSAETDWAVSLMMEPFIMEMRESDEL